MLFRSFLLSLQNKYVAIEYIGVYDGYLCITPYGQGSLLLIGK